MREIKFRAWYKKRKAMFYYGSFDFDDGSVLSADCEKIFMKGEKYDSIDVDPYNPKVEWMQYTGVKDKNGKEIYEGDICEIVNKKAYSYIPKNEFRGVVSFEIGAFWFRVKKGELGIFGAIGELKLIKIGNIYENPELI